MINNKRKNSNKFDPLYFNDKSNYFLTNWSYGNNYGSEIFKIAHINHTNLTNKSSDISQIQKLNKYDPLYFNNKSNYFLTNWYYGTNYGSKIFKQLQKN